MALTTKLEKYEKEQAKPPTETGGAIADNAVLPGCNTLLAWRAKFVGKKITRDGIKWNWCPHHVDPGGKYNGLYYNNHDKSTHAEFAKKKKERFAKYKATRAAGGGTTGGGTPAAGSMKIS